MMMMIIIITVNLEILHQWGTLQVYHGEVMNLEQLTVHIAIITILKTRN